MSHGEGARAAVSQGPGEGTARLTSLFAPPCAVERQNHARELVQGLNLGEWDGIVTVSGDGLLYEVLREPWVLGQLQSWRAARGTPDVSSLPHTGAQRAPGPPRLGGGREDARGHPPLRVGQRAGWRREPAWGVGVCPCPGGGVWQRTPQGGMPPTPWDSGDLRSTVSVSLGHFLPMLLRAVSIAAGSQPCRNPE